MNNYLNEDNRKKFNSIIESFKTIGFTYEVNKIYFQIGF